MPLRYWAIILPLGLGWGASFYFNAILPRGIGELSVSMERVGIGARGCWFWVLVRRIPVRIGRGVLGPLFVFGLFQYAMPLVIYSVAQQAMTSNVAGIVVLRFAMLAPLCYGGSTSFVQRFFRD